MSCSAQKRTSKVQRSATNQSSFQRDEKIVIDIVFFFPISCFGSAQNPRLLIWPLWEVQKLCQQGSAKIFPSVRVQNMHAAADHHLSVMFPAQYPVQIMHNGLSTITTVAMIEAPRSRKSADDKSKPSKYARFGTDLESFQDAAQALPYVYKFFWMIYRLSPVRTIIIIAVFLIQGILPALRLRTGGDFIRQVIL